MLTAVSRNHMLRALNVSNRVIGLVRPEILATDQADNKHEKALAFLQGLSILKRLGFKFLVSGNSLLKACY